MSFFYLDPSAVVKYYVTEPGSAWIRALVDARDAKTGDCLHTLFLGEVSVTEVAAALAILARLGKIPRSERDRAYRRFLADVGTCFQVMLPVSADYYAAADLTQTHPLKAYDAVQLAVGLRLRRDLAGFDLPLTFVSGDGAMLKAAKAEGLTTDDPFAHVVPEDTPVRRQPGG